MVSRHRRPSLVRLPVTALVWFTRDLRVHDHPALRAALDSSRARSCRSSASTTACSAGRHASGPRTQFMLECLADLRERLDGRLVIRRGPPERELRRAGARERRSVASSTSAPTRAPSPAAGSSRVPAGARSRGGRAASPIRGCTPWTTSPRSSTQAGQAVHGLRSLPPHAGSSAAAPRGDRAPARARLAARAALRKGRLPSLASLGLGEQVRGSAAGRRGAGTRAAVALPARRRARLRGQPRRAGPRQHLAAVALSALRVPVPARAGGATAARRRGRGVQAAALLARLPPPRAAALPAQRPLGVPGALPRGDHMEPGGAPLRGVVRGPHGLSAGGRGHAPAAHARAGCTTARGWWSARS